MPCWLERDKSDWLDPFHECMKGAVMANTSTVYLISCVGKKLDHSAPAKDLYDSPWFRLARRHVERQEGMWFILSAKYGLVPPDQIIEPYDQTLRTMNVTDRSAWARRVQRQMDVAVRDAVCCVVLAGTQYREFLMDYLTDRFKTEVPMEGLGIGEQLHWLLITLRGRHDPCCRTPHYHQTPL
jgi:hypothetical protein